ncbi:hypothetical protein L6R50_28120 [Myxococcota bacterium]|nr:hypothetical protein [Myxococcota bacterium]
MHEFGHVFGLRHRNDVLDTMNQNHPLGGDPGGQYRINEHSYVMLKYAKPHSSVGTNLMLLRYEWTDPGSSWLVWTAENASEDDAEWQEARGSCLANIDWPSPVAALVATTSVNVAGVDVTWSFSENHICGDGDEIAFDTNSYSLASNVPYAINASWCIPASGIDPGEYYVCAMIDSTDEVVETDESDNDLRSDKKFKVN